MTERLPPPPSLSDRLRVAGCCRPLTGRVHVEGAKNIALPLLAARSLLPGTMALQGLPRISDVDVQIALLSRIEEGMNGETMSGASTAKAALFQLPEDLTLRSRGAIYAVAAVLCRLGRVRFRGIGGDSLRGRSLAPHMRAFAGFGFAIAEHDGWIEMYGQAPRAAEFSLQDKQAGVTASALALLLAAMAEGRSVISGVSREPEVLEVGRFLSNCGAKIHWDGTKAIVEGPASAMPANWRIPMDRVVWGTYAVAAAATGGTVELPLLLRDWFDPILTVFADSGVEIVPCHNTIVVSGRPKRPVTIETGPFPRFPSDLGPPMLALMAVAPGTSRLMEHVYPDRFDHVRQLASSGLAASVSENVLTVDGGRQLSGGLWRGSGIRESAALLLTGLVAVGDSTITGAAAIARGYEALPTRLGDLGADLDFAAK